MAQVLPSGMAGSGVAWEDVLTSRSGRGIDIGPDGIARDKGFGGNNEQGAEIRMRGAVASRWVGAQDRAVQEAVRHHSKGVMLSRACRALRQLAGTAEHAKGMLIDLGTGFGWHWVGLAAEFPQVKFLLVDLVLENLLVCRSLMPFEAYPNVLCLHADVAELPINDSVGDYGWSVQTLQHLPERKRQAAWHEMRRVLKPDAGVYVAWLRSVPLVRSVYAAFGRSYLVRGRMAGGAYLQRYDEAIEEEWRRVFPACSVTYSETLFHPDLFVAPSNEWLAGVDLWLGATCAAPLFARQAEIGMAAGAVPGA
jgi:ubiquinone/menaquinone biosynthesis C-methylase UbiE